MWYEELFQSIEKLYNKKQSESMSAYMQNKFEFLGIPKPQLKECMKPYLKESKKYPFDWNFVNLCWKKDYREAQYITIEYLNMNIKNINSNDFEKIKKLIITKSWWETVDSLDSIIGGLVQKDSSLESKMLEWSLSDNMWLRRVAIDYQQKYKDKTNTELLEKIIINNLGNTEFFINKAIGWSLREYSKTNPNWVIRFITTYHDKMAKFSIKEASKYI